MRAIVLSTLTALSLAACGAGEGTSSEAADGFIRLPAPGMSMTAAYFVISRDSADRLIAAEVEGVDRTELHTVSEVGGVSQMRMVEGYDIEANAPLVLQPGGNHLMLIGLTEPMAEGQDRDVKLTFRSGAEQTLTLPVRDPRGRRGD